MKSRHATLAVMSVSVLAFGQAPGGPPDPPNPAARAPQVHEGSPVLDWGGGWCHILTPPGQPDGAYATNTWPGGIVPYRFYTLNPPNPPYVSPENQQRAVDAMATIEAVCNVDFIPWTTQTNYVYIVAHPSQNSSFVGMVGGGQAINIAAWTFHYVIVHELGHALGLWHEQQRPDQNLYVTINLGNIQSGFEYNFTIPPGTTAFGPYDFDSVMHYGRYGFTRNGNETISVLPAYSEWKYHCGQRTHLSNGDIWVLTHPRLYGGNRPPRVFELVAPAHRAAVGNTWMPVFEWTASELADSYQLVADDDPSFASPEIDVTVPGTSYTAPSVLPRQEVFYWKVSAANATGQTLAWPRPVRCFYTESTSPGVLYVDDSAPAGGNGASWPTAMKDLQDALELAECAGGLVTEVRAAQGTYKPDRGTGGRDASFPLVGGVTVLGGYAGINAPDPNARDPELYVTTLTGDLAGNDQPGFVNYEENSRHVVFGQGVQGVCILDGLTITGGNADGSPEFLTDEGAGLEAIGSAVEIRDCRAAQWTVTSLNPAGVPESVARGASAGQQVGFARVPLFNGAQHASLWTGTAGSWMDLHPPGAIGDSQLYGVDAGQQVGFAAFPPPPPGVGDRAILWTGTAASWVDLHPAGATYSIAHGVHAGQQVGAALVGGVYRASLWTGTAASWVDLTPAGAPGSYAHGVHAGQQVGSVGVGGLPHASLWTGTGASWVDLHPPGAQQSVARAVHAGLQVGEVYVGGEPRASLWSGTAASWEDLSLAGLPGSFVASEATGVWTDGTTTYVVGWGATAANQFEALLWTKVTCYPDCNADGSLTVADFGCFQTRFVAGEPYADCNQSTTLTVADFGCFQTEFVEGCP